MHLVLCVYVVNKHDTLHNSSRQRETTRFPLVSGVCLVLKEGKASLVPQVGATGSAHSPAPWLATNRGHTGWMLDLSGETGGGGEARGREGVRGRGRPLQAGGCLKSLGRAVGSWLPSWLLLCMPLPWSRELSGAQRQGGACRNSQRFKTVWGAVVTTQGPLTS